MDTDQSACHVIACFIIRENDMNRTLRLALTALGLATAAIAGTSTAHAWGCIAVSEEGSYGYSYNFDDEGDASDRALAECAAKTTTESTCEITECTEGS